MRLGGNGAVRPRAHLVLGVHWQREVWHADVGFGLGTLLEPLPFGPGETHEQAGWRFRVVEDGPELVLQTVQRGGEWTDVYGFFAEPIPLIDVEMSSWWVSTHPRSPFVSGLIVAKQDDDGRRTSLSDWSELALTEETPTSRAVTPVAREEVPTLLEERFGLPGFALDADGRVTLGAG